MVSVEDMVSTDNISPSISEPDTLNIPLNNYDHDESPIVLRKEKSPSPSTPFLDSFSSIKSFHLAQTVSFYPLILSKSQHQYKIL